jgi:hypothetical protein
MAMANVQLTTAMPMIMRSDLESATDRSSEWSHSSSLPGDDLPPAAGLGGLDESVRVSKPGGRRAPRTHRVADVVGAIVIALRATLNIDDEAGAKLRGFAS